MTICLARKLNLKLGRVLGQRLKCSHGCDCKSLHSVLTKSKAVPCRYFQLDRGLRVLSLYLTDTLWILTIGILTILRVLSYKGIQSSQGGEDYVQKRFMVLSNGVDFKYYVRNRQSFRTLTKLDSRGQRESKT